MDKKRPVLSIRQPWAWLIVNGYKDVENRKWRSDLRGMIYVHAPKTFDKDGYNWVLDKFTDILLPNPVDLEFGGVVGEVEIVDCVINSESDWFSGPNGFVLKNGEPLPFYPCKGSLSFFKLK